MSTWTQLLRHPDAIEGLYEVPPPLAQFRLSEVSWEEASSCCTLRGTLSKFADFPRTHWEEDANRVGIRLRLDDVDEFDMEGWSFENIVDIEIAPIEGATRLLLVARGEEMTLRASCAGLQVIDVYAYHSLQAAPAN